MAESSPTVQRRRLGDQVRKIREACGLTGAEVAAKLECTQSKVSKIEGGRRGIRPKELRELLDIYGVEDRALREELLGLARAGNTRGWWAKYSSTISPNYASYIGFEAGATQIVAWEPMVIPGLLQTEEYAREVIRTGGREITAEEIERRVEIRMQRQAQLQKTNPRLWVITDESALRRIVGAPALLRAQLRQLIAASEENPRLTIQVVPLSVGAHPAIQGSLAVLSFDNDPVVVYVETIVGEVYPEGDDLVACTLAADHLKATALGHDQSIALIRKVVDELPPDERGRG